VTPRVLFLLVDALGYDFLSPETTPYLTSIARQGSLLPMTPVLGYSDAQRAALFTGCYPEKIGYWLDFRMAYNSSVLRPFSALGFLDWLPGDLPRRALKFALARTVVPLQARRTGYRTLHLYNMPFRAMRHFQPSLPSTMFDPHPFGDVPTIFDLCRQKGVKFAAVQSDRFGLANMFRMPDQLTPFLSREIQRIDPDVSLLYVYLHSVDMLGHRYGIRSPRFREVLARADRAVQRIVEEAREKLGKDLELVIVSDHGLNHTERFVSYGKLLRQPGFGRDYLVALDSTMVRLWYFQHGVRPGIRQAVEESGHGRFLGQEELRHLGVYFESRDYYDEVYLLRPGLSIFPNYHSYLKPMAMHAYHPDEPDQRAIALFHGRRLAHLKAPEGSLHITDIMPTISQVLGLDPSQATGSSLLPKGRRRT